MSEEVITNLGPVEIQTYQQNRYPMLFVDCIDEAVPGKYAKGHKCLSYNEWYFPIHFADEPNMPGFVQAEMLCQVFLMTFLTFPENKGKKTAALDYHVKYKMKLVPGMRVDIEATLKSYRRGIAIGSAVGYVDGAVAVSADFMIAIPDVLNQFKPKQE
jgi:3-hydroxyacyl-[acyl-carrier-protein] dehydratase